MFSVCCPIRLISLGLHFLPNDAEKIRPTTCFFERHPVEEDDVSPMSMSRAVVDLISPKIRKHAFGVARVSKEQFS
jgi:hypothetical protein